MRPFNRLPAGVVAAGVLWLASPVSGQIEVPQYHVRSIGSEIAQLIPGAGYGFGSSINQDGDVVGEVWLSTQRQAWIYSIENGVTLLPTLPGYLSDSAHDLSDRDSNGEITAVGIAQASIYAEGGRAMLWRYSTVSGQVLETRDVGGLPGTQESVLVAINNDGIAVGHSTVPGQLPMKYDVATAALEPLDFPVVPADVNNAGQVVGGRYRGDLFGNYADLGIPPDCTYVFLNALNDLGDATGRAGRPFTDGAGHFMVSVVRHVQGSWHVLPPFSHFDSGSDINVHADIVGSIGVSAAIRGMIYIDALSQIHLLEDLAAPGFSSFMSAAYGISDAGQITGAGALLLTPLGSMVIPGDVDGNAVVDLDDLCAWIGAPIDLDGNGIVDAADEQWLVDRLAVFGFQVNDCNMNGSPDHCDIVDLVSADCDENGVPDECQPDCNGDGVPDVCEPDCNANGIPDACDIATGSSLDCNENGIPDECDGGGFFQALNAFDPPVQLLPSDTYVDTLLVSDAGTVDDLDVVLDVDYRIGNLSVLLSHDGVTITLIDQPGVTPSNPLGNGQLGYDIILDDEGTGGAIQDKGNFGSPFEPITSPPSYSPMESLSAFDGMSAQGLWTVTVLTNSQYSPASSFKQWGLSFEIAATPVGLCDCNDNMIADDLDIASGFSLDVNGNGIPDECEAFCQSDLGFGGPGSATLSLCGGDLSSGTTADFALSGAAPSQPAAILAGFENNPAAFKGGWIVPIPVAILLPVMTDATGSLTVTNIPGGGGPLSLYVQAVYSDPTQPQGFGLSNALEVEFLP